ncbi:MAG: hypothetical protein ACI9EB_002023 [Pseudomonas sp.]|jgi:hypothetical protein
MLGICMNITHVGKVGFTVNKATRIAEYLCLRYLASRITSLRGLVSTVLLLMAPLITGRTDLLQPRCVANFYRQIRGVPRLLRRAFQLNLGSAEGAERGATKLVVYDGARAQEQATTRLFLDASSAVAWRRKHFPDYVPISADLKLTI